MNALYRGLERETEECKLMSWERKKMLFFFKKSTCLCAPIMHLVTGSWQLHWVKFWGFKGVWVSQEDPKGAVLFLPDHIRNENSSILSPSLMEAKWPVLPAAPAPAGACALNPWPVQKIPALQDMPWTIGWALGWVQSPSTMVTGEKFMGVLCRAGYFGPDPKPSSGVVPLHTTLHVSAVLSQRKIPLPILIK